MIPLSIPNPFNAPVYFEETVNSTMDVSRRLAARGEPHGTGILADYQTQGRGRGFISGLKRTWEMEKGNMAFTVFLKFSGIEDIPKAITLRAGLAAACAIEELIPSLSGNVKIKWPNDILIKKKTFKCEPHELHEPNKNIFKFMKAAGILCEADGQTVYVGIGINVFQKKFPPKLEGKATSIALTSGINIAPEKRFELTEMVLQKLYEEFGTANLANINTNHANNWKLRLEQRLYKMGEPVSFIEGAAGSGREIHGILKGTGDNGELLIETEKKILSFTTGELKLYAPL